MFDDGSESLNLARFLVALKHDVPGDNDNDQEKDPIQVARYTEVTACKICRVLSDHCPNERQRHIGIVPGAHPGELDYRSVWGSPGLYSAYDLLLPRPDAEPHVERHDRSEHSPRMDKRSSITEVG